MTLTTNKHRNFYVNEKLEFAFFYDEKVKDKKLILDDFFSGKDWIWFQDYNKIKIESTEFSKDLTEVFITVKPK